MVLLTALPFTFWKSWLYGAGASKFAWGAKRSVTSFSISLHFHAVPKSMTCRHDFVILSALVAKGKVQFPQDAPQISFSVEC